MAPSPTGLLHLGTTQTTLYNWLFARHHGGEFILRIEDTDLERSRKEYEENIINGLKSLGITWDNSKIIRQSERLDRYEEVIRKLVEEGKAFWCDHSKEELEAEAKQQMDAKEPPRHLCEHKDKNLKKGQVIRLKVNTAGDRAEVFHDEIRGDIKWTEALLGDFSIARDFRNPLYNFAVVVDDIDMEITHVIRGEDHISNTPKQILIYEALGSAVPKFAHLPLILAPDRSKLSKRHGAVSIDEYTKDYLPEALINFLGFLGYTYSKEILTKEEMAQEFDLEKVHSSGAIWDIKKLNWINSQWIKQKPEVLKKLNPDIPDEALPVITERLERLSDYIEFSYLWNDDFDYAADLLIWKKSDKEKTHKALNLAKMAVESSSSSDDLRLQLEKIATDEFGGDKGSIFWPVRVALSGKDRSPDPIQIFDVIKKIKVGDRIEKALAKLAHAKEN